jgi:aminoglycoside 6-adenylyltransferase
VVQLDVEGVAREENPDMHKQASEMSVIDQLIEWADQQPSVRAMLLTSSRAVPNAQLDVLSDYDVILVVRDVEPFYEDRSWLQSFGPVLAVYRDPLEPYLGFLQAGYVTQYESGLKIDFRVWPVALLQRIVDEPQLPDELDAGYRILLEKEHLTDALKQPTFAAYIPKPPTLDRYQEIIELFYLDAAYVAKFLWRGDVLAAKHVLDNYIKQDYLRPMLEWRIEIDHNWSVKPGPYMRGLQRWLRRDLWNELKTTYTGAVLEDNWDALDKTVVLFRSVASEVGASLGYPYPRDLDRGALAYLDKVKRLDVGAERID